MCGPPGHFTEQAASPEQSVSLCLQVNSQLRIFMNRLWDEVQEVKFDSMRE